MKRDYNIINKDKSINHKFNKWNSFIKKMLWQYKNINNNKINLNYFGNNDHEEYDDELNPINNYNNHYNFNDNGYYNDSDDLIPKNKKSKKGFTWAIMGSILGSLAIGAGIAALVLYILDSKNNQISNNNNSNDSSISDYYRENNNARSIDAMNYILQRTITMQFLFINQETNNAQSISGTGWIFNKDSNSSTYYIATNLHVAAALTYQNRQFEDNGQIEDFSGYMLATTYIGFVEPNFNSSTANYNSTNINMLNVQTPQIAYTATNFGDPNGFGSVYNNTLLQTQNYGFNRKAMIDFAILKFNFDESLLSRLNKESAYGNSANASKFIDWLQYYNQSPTQFYENAIPNLNTTNASDKLPFNKKIFMGGFPGLNNKTNYVGSWSSNKKNYLNFGGTQWIGFADVPLAVNLQGYQLDRISKIYSNTYNNFASGFLNWINKYASGVSFFDDSISTSSLNCINIGYQALIDASSVGGSSGSMMIIDDNGTFKVVGIYWGQVTYSDGTNVGVGNFLYVDNYQKYSTTNEMWPGYNIFQYALNFISNNEDVNFLYNPIFK